MNIPAHTKVPQLGSCVETGCGISPLQWGSLVSQDRARSPFKRYRARVLLSSGFFFVCRHPASVGLRFASRSHGDGNKLAGWDWLETSAESRKDRPASQGCKCSARSTVDNFAIPRAQSDSRLQTVVVRMAQVLTPSMGWGVLRPLLPHHRQLIPSTALNL